MDRKFTILFVNWRHGSDEWNKIVKLDVKQNKTKQKTVKKNNNPELMISWWKDKILQSCDLLVSSLYTTSLNYKHLGAFANIF